MFAHNAHILLCLSLCELITLVLEQRHNCLPSLSLRSERLHAASHRSQEESDGDHHHAAGVRRLHQHGDTPGNHASAPCGAGRQRGHRDAAAGSRRARQHGQ